MSEAIHSGSGQDMALAGLRKPLLDGKRHTPRLVYITQIHASLRRLAEQREDIGAARGLWQVSRARDEVNMQMRHRFGEERGVDFRGRECLVHRLADATQQRAERRGLLSGEIRQALDMPEWFEDEPTHHRDRLKGVLQPPQPIVIERGAGSDDLAAIGATCDTR
jgi:hypothetical protein